MQFRFRKHAVSINEVRDVLLSRPRIRFTEKGHVQGEDVYAAFGQTIEGRFLVIFFVFKAKDNLALVISARSMSAKERKSYGKKKK